MLPPGGESKSERAFQLPIATFRRLWTVRVSQSSVIKPIRESRALSTGDPLPKRTIIILPTYNEALNIRAMLEALATKVVGVDVLVVDDSSPDGTAEIVDRFRVAHRHVNLLVRTERDGFAYAYRAGFRWAIERGYDFIVQMDADFSHDPADVARLIQTGETADFAVGCRYRAGGKIVGWSRSRLFISRLGNWYARILLGIPFADLTGGFNLFRRQVLEAINLDLTGVRGYSFQILLKTLAHRQGFRGVEVPIVFRERVAGYSKMSFSIASEAVLQVPQLQWKTGKFGLRHLLAGAAYLAAIPFIALLLPVRYLAKSKK